MNYIYDVYLNFNKCAYDFFEWKENDKLEHIRKIPVFKIKTSDLYNIINNCVKFDYEYTELIFNQTEKYNFDNIPYSMLLLDDYTVLAVKLDKNGKVIYKSKLLPDEEEEILRISRKYNTYNIKYEIINKEEITFFTRYEKNVKKVLNNEIELSYKNKEYSKLRYMYNVLFDKNIDNYNKMKNDLISSMDYNLNDKHIELYTSLLIANKNKV